MAPIITFETGMGTNGNAGKWQAIIISRRDCMEKKVMLMAVPIMTTKASVGDKGNNFRPTVLITFLSAIKQPTPMAKQTLNVMK